MDNSENFDEKLLLKTNYWQIQSVKVNFDRNWNVASMYILFANPKMHQYTKRQYLTVSDFVDYFGNPSEFTEQGISAMIVGTWIKVSEFMEILDEEPMQTKNSF